MGAHQTDAERLASEPVLDADVAAMVVELKNAAEEIGGWGAGNEARLVMASADTIDRLAAALSVERDRVRVLEEAVMAVIEASRAYLPPDGISADEFINRVLQATDNPRINSVIMEPRDVPAH